MVTSIASLRGNALVSITVAVLLGLTSTTAVAQGPPGRGDGGRSDSRGGRPDFGGGRPDFGGGPSDFLRRLDANGNGMIDPEEAQGRAGFFLQRMAETNPSLNFSRPVPLDRLTQEFERMRGQRSGDSSGGSSSQNRSSSSSSSSSSSTPLVPGFGVDLQLPPVPGFGDGADALIAIKILDNDRREADDRMRRYDRNNDGHLDRDELRDGRWSDDPFQYDRNKDGRLSRDELAMRNAKRRSDEEQQRASSSSRSSSSRSSSPASSGSSSGGTGSSSSMTDTRIRYMVDDTFRRYDANNSGAFERDEWSSFRTDPSEADKNRDGRITRDELTEWMAARFGGSGGPGGASGSSMSSGGVRGPSGGFGSRDESSREGDQRGGWFGSRGSSRGGDPNVPARSGDNSAEQRKSFRFASPTERLPSGLPDWFARCDADADGQVRMSEFASQWSTATVAEFLRFDLNGDGLITPEECLQAKTAGAVRGDSPLPASSGISAGASSSGLSSRSPSAAIAAAPVASASAPAVSASAPAASSSGSIDASYLRYAEGLIKKYDTDGDGELTASEWNKMSRSPDGADADGNGRITVEEYARSLMNR